MKREHVLEFSRPDIDGNVIRAVKVIGLRSKHGWAYSPDVLKAAMPLYESSPVFIEHPDAKEKSKGHRQLGDHFGSLENIRGNGQGLFADLKIRESHPLAKAVLEAAPTARFGLSHNAVVELDEAKINVMKIVEVHSVDLVDRPGTTTNLFEEGPSMAQFEEKVLAFMEEIQAVVKAQGAALEAVTEAAPAPPAAPAPLVAPPATPPRRLVALEAKGGNSGGSIGNTHEAFLDTLRGFHNQ